MVSSKGKIKMQAITRKFTNEQVLELFNTRYSCKSYDPNKTVSDADLETILEAARLSPSSMGLEPWHFLVISNKEVIEEIMPYCWGVHPSPSHFIVILGLRAQELLGESEFVAHIHTDVQKRDPLKLAARYQAIDKFLHSDHGYQNDELEVQAWSNQQGYIALANILTASAMIGVDSTAIEGMQYAQVSEVLVKHGLFDPQKYQLSAMVTLGYTDREEHRPKTRREAKEVFTFVK